MCVRVMMKVGVSVCVVHVGRALFVVLGSYYIRSLVVSIDLYACVCVFPFP